MFYDEICIFDEGKFVFYMAELSSVLIVQFSKEKAFVVLEENDSNDTLEDDDDAHKVVLCASGHVFCFT